MKVTTGMKDWKILKKKWKNKWVLEQKTLFAYWFCFKYISKTIPIWKKFQRMGYRVIGMDIENWWSEQHYQKWIEESGNDWQGVVSYLLKHGNKL